MAKDNVVKIGDKQPKKQDLFLYDFGKAVYDEVAGEFNDPEDVVTEFNDIDGYQVNEHFIAVVQKDRTTVMPVGFKKIVVITKE